MKKRIGLLFKLKVKRLMRDKKKKSVLYIDEKYDPLYNPEYIDKEVIK